MKRLFLLSIGVASLLTAFLCIGLPEVVAYEQYAQGCIDCHGDYNSGDYVSNVDGQVWGTDLMSGHMDAFLGNDCDACHTGPGYGTVFLKSSDGGDGLAALGCVGCHGRDEGSGATATGLRQHHWNNEVNVCLGCHSDSDPGTATPVDEIIRPPYYANPGNGHTIPDQPCNLASQGYPEDVLGAAGTGGLDNDGDDVYDTGDSDCASILPVEESTWGRVKALYR